MIYLAYSCADGVHRNIQLAILDPRTLQTVKTVPVAVGGGLKDRVNINVRPALAFDRDLNTFAPVSVQPKPTSKPSVVK